MIGVYASFFIDSAPAPTIVVTLSVMFIAAFIWQTRQTASQQLAPVERETAP